MPHASRSDWVSKGRGAAFVLAWIAVAALPATAGALTVYDFDDFEAYSEDYGCNGKNFCTDSEVYFEARNQQIGLDELSTRRFPVEASFSTPGRGNPAIVLGGVPGDTFLTGNDFGMDDGSLSVLTGDFSKDLLFAQVDLGTPIFFEPCVFADCEPSGTVEQFVFLEIWSDPGATGILLGRAELLASDAPAEEFVTLGLAAPEGTSFRSIRFGKGFSPGCEAGCSTEADGNNFADNVVVQAVPEPGSAVLFGAAIASLGILRRARLEAVSDQV